MKKSILIPLFSVLFLFPIKSHLAINNLEISNKSTQKNLKRMIKLANTSFNKGHYQNAITGYTNLINKYPDMSVNYYLPYAYFYRGQAKYEIDNYEGSIVDYNKAIEIGEDRYSIKKAYYDRGLSKHEIEDYEGAIEDYTYILENKLFEFNKPKSVYVPANVYYQRARSKFKLMDDQGAVEDYNEAIELQPNEAYHYYARGYTKYFLADYDGSISDMNKVLKMKFRCSHCPYLFIGHCKYDQNLYDEAINYYTKYLDKEPTAKVYFYRAEAKMKKEAYSEAIKDIDQAIELDPENANYYRERGYCNYLLSLDHQALKDFNKAIELNPEDAENYLYRSDVYYELKNYDASIEDLNKAISIDATDPEFYYYRAEAYIELNDFETACTDVATAMVLVDEIKTNKEITESELVYYDKVYANVMELADGFCMKK